MSETLWDTKDVSKYLNVKEGTIRYWVHIHAIRHYKLGALVRYIPEEITKDFHDGNIGKPGFFKG